jgi:hypothetical protein
LWVVDVDETGTIDVAAVVGALDEKPAPRVLAVNAAAPAAFGVRLGPSRR